MIMVNKILQTEILKRMEQLSEEEQRQVLRYARDLPSSPKKEGPAHFLDLFGTLDHESAQEMMQIIEEDCERIDANDW